MSPAQLRLYRAEWGKVRRCLRARGLSPAQADQARHEAHVQALGTDKSSLALNNKELDAVLRVFRSISCPGDLQTQLELAAMARRRLHHYIRMLCGALEVGEDYAVGTARAMNRQGRIGQPAAKDRAHFTDPAGNVVPFDYAHTKDGTPARRELVLEDSDEGELEKVMIALKRQCRRRWPTKPALLKAIRKLRHDVAGVDGLGWDALVEVISALHAEAAHEAGCDTHGDEEPF